MSRSMLTLVAAIFVAAVYAIWWMGNDSTRDADAAIPIIKVEVPALSANAQDGEQLFNANCAVCHGTNAAGKQNIAPPLVHIIYEPNHHGDHSFILAAKNGVRAHHWPFGNMPPVEGVTDEQVKLITLYVRELQRANGIF